MRLLLISYYHEKLPGSPVQRCDRMARFLRAKGHEVSLLGGTHAGDRLDDPALLEIHDPSFNLRRSGIRKLSWLARRLGLEALNRLGVYASMYGSWKRRVLGLADKIVAAGRPQAVIASYPPVEDLEIGLRLARHLRIPLVADFRDGLLFEAIESVRLRRFACVRRAYAALEQEIAAVSDALTTVSQPLSEYFRRTYGHARVRTVPNGFDPGDAAAPLPAITLESGCFHVVHSGRFALSDAGCDIAPLVGALEALLAERPPLAARLRIHLLGRLSRRERRMLSPLVRRGVVRLHGQVDRPQARAFQRRADLLLLVTSPSRSSVATTKLFEYLQARRPVLALTEKSFASEIVEKTRCGWVVPPQSARQIREAFERLLDDPAWSQRLDLTPQVVSSYSFTVSMVPLGKLLRAIEKEGAEPGPPRGSP
ncbi:MAG: glycosyltransferase [Candidatus Aminicenantes bacterium]|nr:glycosyltransferase [Candidatus Aminicenantes bacterium]